MTIPIFSHWRRLGLSLRFYVILVAALAGAVGATYLGLSAGNPEMAQLMTGLLLDLAPAVVAVSVVGAVGIWLVHRVLGR